MTKRIVAEKFDSDHQLHNWLNDASNLAALKKQYPPPQYQAEVNFINKEIIVTDMSSTKGSGMLRKNARKTKPRPPKNTV